MMDRPARFYWPEECTGEMPPCHLTPRLRFDFFSVPASVFFVPSVAPPEHQINKSRCNAEKALSYRSPKYHYFVMLTCDAS